VHAGALQLLDDKAPARRRLDGPTWTSSPTQLCRNARSVTRSAGMSRPVAISPVATFNAS
jgi:hypothetical protein